jgi:antitoxin HigA-1
MPTARAHPGQVLREKFLVPRHMDERALADAIDLPVKHVREIVCGRQAMTASTASKLARYFQTTPEFWLSLQAAYDLNIERDEDDEGNDAPT